MHVHILGICGTFMGGIAALAREAGHRVTGSDRAAWPPMSTQLEAMGIEVQEGFDPAHLDPAPDIIVVGNVMTRGNPAIEHMLDRNLPYTSGPEWLARHLLHDRWVLAVAGTHGKTTTSSLLAFILDHAGLEPGFLIGGVAADFGVSARYGRSPFFVVEADEYDTAFFDKRSKFVHYRPRTAILNNLEFDHADIFTDLAAIERQFHHLVRTIPGTGLIVAHDEAPALDRVLDQGCWTPVTRFGGRDAEWGTRLLHADGSAFEVLHNGRSVGAVNWSLRGQHNVDNGLAALLAARHAGVPLEQGLTALGAFSGVARRLDLKGTVDEIRVYDDFAHHPTAIRKTLAAARAIAGNGRVLAALEPRSNTMRLGTHADELAGALAGADAVHVLQRPDLNWDATAALAPLGAKLAVHDSSDALADDLCHTAQPGDVIILMSNGAFDGLPQSLPYRLQEHRQ